MKSVGLEEIHNAERRILPYIRKTSTISVQPFGLRIKLESTQPVGSFKIRGALNTILSLTEEERRNGVVASSSGNHAQAVAYACKLLGIRATIIMPEVAPEAKVSGARLWGPEIIIHGRASDELEERAAEISRSRGIPIVAAFDSDKAIAGAGTAGLEILADAPDIHQVFVPVGGGGLLSGVAAAVKQFRPEIRIIGVEPALADDAYRSFQVGHIVGLTPDEAGRTIADGLRVQRLSELTWHHIRTFVDEIRTVTEEEIEAAMRFLALRARVIAEPSGATSIAAALQEPEDRQRGSVAILSGGNVNLDLFARVIS